MDELKDTASHQEIQKVIEDSRRNFLKKAGISIGAVVSGAAAILAGLRHEGAKNKNKFVRVLTTDNKLLKVPVEEIEGYTPTPEQLQVRGREGIKGKRWVWVVDLSKCRNARNCIASCQAAHHLRPYEYHINTLVMQEAPNTPAYFMPKPCQHCDNPPCVSVCPVDATYKRPDGPVLIDNMRCIGCRFCIAACPYNARIFHWQEPKEYEADKGKKYDVELNIPQRKGTITKCLMSCDRLRNNELPYCVSSCPNGVYYFGNEYEDAVTNGTTKETVKLSELLKNNGAYRLMPELGTKPRVYYLPPKNRIFDFDKEKPDPEDFIIQS